ncbi:MAG: hypothetical protein KJN90_02550 [Gammaproteobacteria bacterium]|nr:hypothetical protein [Gammaproteobacteria bacterium]
MNSNTMYSDTPNARRKVADSNSPVGEQYTLPGWRLVSARLVGSDETQKSCGWMINTTIKY